MQVYEPNLKDFSNLDEKDVQEEGINMINLNESKNKVNKENNNFALVVDEEI